MNVCDWAEVHSINPIASGIDGGTLYSTIITYGTSLHPDVGRVDGVHYPQSYSDELNVEWMPITEKKVYCSQSKPTVIHDGYPIRTFHFPTVFGYETTDAQLYLVTCHGINAWASEELLTSLGYPNVLYREFSFIDELLGKSNFTSRPVKKVFFRVVGVASNDVLNIRSRPTSRSEIIDAFAYNEPLVEITGQNGKWVRVNSAGRSGWAYSAYLEPIELPTFLNTNLPNGLKCYGEEPFWTITLTNNQIHLESITFEEATYTVSNIQEFGNGNIIQGINSSGDQIEVKVTDEITMSSMAEIYYNWSVSLKLNGDDGYYGATGCAM